MSINLGLPQIIYLTIMLMGLGITIVEHGTPKNRDKQFLGDFYRNSFYVLAVNLGWIF